MTTRDAAQSAGTLLLVGGRFEDDNNALFDAMEQHGGGDILVFATASGSPEEVGGEMVADLRARGIGSESVPLTPENASHLAHDPALCDRVGRAGGAYFTGGDQLRIRQSLIIDGADTPLLSALRDMNARGGLIAGSSAGAAMQSDPMILGGASGDALAFEPTDDPDTPGLALGPGLGFFRAGLLDQHFIERGRIGRLAAALGQSGQRFGYGIDENTGLLVRGDRGEVLGETGVVLVDMRHARASGDGRAVSDIRISYLDAGDSVDLSTGRLHPGARKTPLKPRRDAALSRTASMPRDAFGSYSFHDVWLRLAAGDPRSYTEEHLRADVPRSRARIDLRLHRRARVSRVWQAEGRYSMANFLLDIEVGGGAAPFAPLNRRRPRHAVTPRRQSGTIAETSASTGLGRDTCVELSGSEPVAHRERGNRATLTLDWSCPPRDLETAFADIDTAAEIELRSPDRQRILSLACRLGADGPLRAALAAALRRRARIGGTGEAAVTLGHEVITDGGPRAALRWGVSADAGSEGLVVARGLGLVPGIVECDIAAPGRFGALVLACAERQMIGWGIPEKGGLDHYRDAGQVRALGPDGAFGINVEPAKVKSGPGRIEVLDAILMPVSRERGGWPPARDCEDLPTSLAPIEALVRQFATELGASAEGTAGQSWIGDGILLRLHRRRGFALLDLSCDRTKMIAAHR